MTLRGFIVAARFLTRIPLPGPPVEADELARSIDWFPIVGAIVGGATAAIIVSTERWLGPFAIVLGLVFAALVTGGLHEDGLADTCDGLGGGSTRERRLEIMRDSRIGSYGAMAIALLYLARFTLFSQLGRALLFILPVAAALARTTSIALMAWLPNARGSGTADDTARNLRPITVVVGIGLALAIAFALAPTLAVWMLAIAALLTLLSGAYLKNRLGGITGDTLGAVNVVVEIATLAIAAVAIATVVRR